MFYFVLQPISWYKSPLSNEPCLVWVINNPTAPKYVATKLCNLSPMACFADINVSQASVATYARCSGVFDIYSTTNLPRNFPLKN